MAKKKAKVVNLFGSDVVARVAKSTDETKATVAKVINEVFFTIGRHLHETKEDAGTVKFSGLGTFTTSFMAARVIKNHLPTNKSNKKIKIPESYIIRFRSGKKLKDLVKDGEIVEETKKPVKKATKAETPVKSKVKAKVEKNDRYEDDDEDYDE